MASPHGSISDKSRAGAVAPVLDAVIIIGALVLWAVLVAGGHRFVPDDVLFFLQIADHIFAGHGSTFNGIVPTNGYHPLWMVVCLVLRSVIGANREMLVQALFIVCAGLHVTTLILLRRLLLCWDVHHRWAALLAATYFIVANAPGSEFHLSLPLLIVLVGRVSGDSIADPRGLLVTGVVAGFTMLARLDNVFVVGALTLYAATRGGAGRATALIRIALLGGMAAVVVAPYLAWNLLTFGSLMPISGAVKSAKISIGFAKLGRQGLTVGAFALLAALAARAGDSRRWILRILAAGCLAHLAFLVVTMEFIWTWYFAGELLTASLGLAFIADRIDACVRTASEGRAAFLWRALPALCIVVAFSAALVRRIPMLFEPESDFWYIEAAKTIDKVVPEGAGLATTSSPGSIAYFSHRAIFAFDGLTLDFAYHHEAGRLGLAPYLASKGIHYLISVSPDSAEARGFMDDTRRLGRVENTAYLPAPGGKRVDALTIWSPILRRDLGTIRIGRAAAVAKDFCSRDLTIWKID